MGCLLFKRPKRFNPGSAFIPPPSLGNIFSLTPRGEKELNETQHLRLTVAVQQLIRAYQVMGHNKVTIDLLNLQKHPDVPPLDPASYGIKESQMDYLIKKEDIQVQSVTFGFLDERPSLTIRE